MTRLLIAATVLIGLARALSQPPRPPTRWPPEALFGVEAIEVADELSRIPHCCFGCLERWSRSYRGIRYVPDENETLLAMLPTDSRNRDPPAITTIKQ